MPIKGIDSSYKERNEPSLKICLTRRFAIRILCFHHTETCSEEVVLFFLNAETVSMRGNAHAQDKGEDCKG